MIATHSPVLISQFESSDIIATELNEDNSTRMRRVGDMPDLADLLAEYAAGSLYMSEALAKQSLYFFEDEHLGELAERPEYRRRKHGPCDFHDAGVWLKVGCQAL